MVNRVNRNVEFLTNDSGELVGYQKSPGNEVGIVTAQTNNVTGGIELSPDIGVPFQAKAGGTPALPVSTFDGASSSGAFGLPKRILIPANTLKSGSRIRLSVHLGKTGAGVAFFQVHLGPLDSLTDPNLLDGAAPQFTTLTPSKWILDINMSCGTSSINAVWHRASLNVGQGSGFPAEKTGLDFAVDNYVNLAITGAAAASTYTLIEYHLEVFP